MLDMDRAEQRKLMQYAHLCIFSLHNFDYLLRSILHNLLLLFYKFEKVFFFRLRLPFLSESE